MNFKASRSKACISADCTDVLIVNWERSRETFLSWLIFFLPFAKLGVGLLSLKSLEYFVTQVALVLVEVLRWQCTGEGLALLSFSSFAVSLVASNSLPVEDLITGDTGDHL